MGWFLSGSEGRPKRKSRKKAEAPKAWDPARTWAVLQILAAAGLVAAVCFGWKHAESALSGYAKKHEVQPVGIDDVVLADKPAWIDERMKLYNELRAIVAGRISSDPLDNNGLQKAAQALSASPWVKHVSRVQRLTDGRVWVSASFREPVAMVERENYCHLVAVDGFRLPGVYEVAQARTIGLPMITGVPQQPCREGQHWDSEELKAGLSLVDLLQGEPYLSQVEAFEVGERDARKRIRLVLRTKNGMVRWGLPPGQEGSIEPEAATKKQWLSTVYKRRGQIDAGGRVVDVYGAAVFVHQPESEDADITVGYHWDR